LFHHPIANTSWCVMKGKKGEKKRREKRHERTVAAKRLLVVKGSGLPARTDKPSPSENVRKERKKKGGRDKNRRREKTHAFARRLSMFYRPWRITRGEKKRKRGERRGGGGGKRGKNRVCSGKKIQQS